MVSQGAMSGLGSTGTDSLPMFLRVHMSAGQARGQEEEEEEEDDK
jgi:hypothetical protein